MYLPLDRHKSKIVALILLGIGFVLAPDVLTFGMPPMSDLLNHMIANPLADYLSTSYIEALALTYLFAFTLIGLGLLIYPYNTTKLVMGRFHAFMKLAARHPLILIGMIIIAITIFLYGEMLSDWAWNWLITQAQGVL